MKRKRWLALVLSAGFLGLGAQQVWAWGCKCNNKYSTYICCRPYNAFTPVCFGSLCCDGCCPSFGGCGARSWSPACQTPPFIPPALCAPPMMPPPCCDPCGCGSFPGYPGGGYPGGGFPGGGFPGGGFPGGGFQGGGFQGAGYPPMPYMLSPPPFNGPAPNFGQPPVPNVWNAPGTRPAHYPRGVYPGFWPNYPAGYWTSAYAPWPNGPWGTP